MVTDDPFRLGWIVGVIEGEGCISWTKKAVINVAMCDLDTIERLQSWSGCGQIRSIKKQQDHHKQLWLWQVAKQREFLDVAYSIEPHLSGRRATQLTTTLERFVEHRSYMMERAAQRREMCPSGHIKSDTGIYNPDFRCAQCHRDRVGRRHYASKPS